MPVREPWFEGETNDEREARRAAYERLAASAHRVGLPLEQLAVLLRRLQANEEETRRFLGDIYRVPDHSLDDFLRLRLKDLAREDPGPREQDEPDATE